MSKWSFELTLLSRYATAGVLNAVIGLSTIFILTAVGFSPLLSNFSGYAVGLSLSFFIARHYVFRAEGKSEGQMIRYLLSFFASFMTNLTVLHLSIDYFSLSPFFSQSIAISTYILAMYFLSRFYVFNRNSNKATTSCPR